MNKRLKFLGALLGVLYVFFLGYSLYRGVPEFIVGFKSGMKAAEEYRESNSAISSEFLFTKVKPKDIYSNFFPTKITEESGLELNASISDIGIMIVNVERSMPATIFRVITGLLILSLIFVVFYFPFLVYKIFRSIIKKDLFDSASYRIFNRIGYIIIYFFAVTFLVGLQNFIEAKRFIQLQDYNVTFDFSEGIYILFLGIFSLFFAEILKIATGMKEEQEFTI